jgi:hypothetical protein
VAEFNRASYSLAGGSQGGIGNAEKQTLLMAGSNPSLHTTREKSHFPRMERYSSHCGALQTNLNKARSQHHSENVIILHLHEWTSDRRKHIHCHSHSCVTSPRAFDALIVIKNSARFGPKERTQAQGNS